MAIIRLPERAVVFIMRQHRGATTGVNEQPRIIRIMVKAQPSMCLTDRCYHCVLVMRSAVARVTFGTDASNRDTLENLVHCQMCL